MESFVAVVSPYLSAALQDVALVGVGIIALLPVLYCIAVLVDAFRK